MLSSIKEFFIRHLECDRESDPDSRDHEIRSATAALMIEIGLADSHIQKEEWRLIRQSLQDRFRLSSEDTEELIAIAESEIDHSVSLYEFTRLLNERLSRDERIRIIEMLWQVAYADNVLDKYEEYYIRKIADLLYIAHGDYIKAKLRVENQSA